MKFKSKIDWWLQLVFGLTVAGMICGAVMPPISRGEIIAVHNIMFVSCILTILLVVPIWLNTYYIMGENELRVKCGFFPATKIPYESIKKIRATNSPIASSALSLDRIEIIYGVGGGVLISPENRQEFLRQLEIKTGKNWGDL